MKKTKKSRLCIMMIVMLTVSCLFAFNVSATTETMSITLRIEGINSNMFYKTVEVPYTDTLTLQAALTYIDTQEDSIKITGADTAYITDINGDTAAKFGGYDGWLFKVNGIDAATGIDGCILADGDSVDLYYGDPFGVGMQFPKTDYSKIADGIIKFTSSDTTYDADYNPTVTENPIVGATVVWNYDNTSATYTTDANGEIKIDSVQLSEGKHAVQITKTKDTGIPLVLRLAPDYNYEVNAKAVAVTEAEPVAVVDVEVAVDNPQTKDDNNNVTYIILLAVSAAVIISVYTLKRKNSHEK